MKHLLLSTLLVAGLAAQAADVTYNFAEPAGLTPSITLEDHVSGDQTQTYTNVSGTKFTNGDITFVADSAVEKATSPRIWKATAGISLRVYKNNTLTFTTSKGTITNVVFNNANTNWTAATANAGAIVFDGKVGTWGGSTNNLVITVDANSKTVSINNIVVTYDPNGTPGEGGGEVPDQPQGPTTATFEKVSSITSGGSYVFVSKDGKVGAVIDESKEYGRLALEAPTESTENSVVTNVANAITINAVEGGYVLIDSYNRYLSMDATHFTSFQLYKEQQGGSLWIASFNNGAVEFVNTQDEGCTIGQGYANDSTLYTNIAPAAAGAKQELPYLYKRKTTSIADINAEAEAPIEYYNLQGILVKNPANGIYIRRQGTRSSKVAL